MFSRERTRKDTKEIYKNLFLICGQKNGHFFTADRVFELR